MTGPTTAPQCAQTCGACGACRLALLAAALALAGCAGTLGPPPEDKDRSALRDIASNLTSLSEVIEKHPERSAGLQYARLGLWRGRPNEQALADFNKAISLDPELRAGLRQPRAHLSQDQQARSGARRRQQGAVDRRLYAPAYLGRGIVYRQQGRATCRRLAISTRRSRSSPTMRRPITIAGLLYQSQHQHQFAIDDFSTAIGLTGAEGRALCRARR
jgi:tetratricopeptide (TPR) repeat protein